MNQGIIIVIEGYDGSGKTTIRNYLRDKLTNDGFNVVTCFQPGGSYNADRIRNMLLDNNDWPEAQMDTLTQTYMHLAARADVYNHIIKPAVEEGSIVICDRHYLSSLVYQMEHWDIILNNRVFEPDLWLKLEVPFDISIERQQRRIDNAINQPDTTTKENGRYQPDLWSSPRKKLTDEINRYDMDTIAKKREYYERYQNVFRSLPSSYDINLNTSKSLAENELAFDLIVSRIKSIYDLRNI